MHPNFCLTPFYSFKNCGIFASHIVMPTMKGMYRCKVFFLMRRGVFDRRRGAFTPQGAARHVSSLEFEM